MTQRPRARCRGSGKGMHENWPLDDILKTHTAALKASELMRFARLPNKLRFSREQSAAIENLSPSLVEELVMAR